MGFIKVSVITIVSVVPTIAYLAIRARAADSEDVIQTAIAILAATLYIVAAPVYAMLFNGWELKEVLAGKMTLDSRTVRNIKSKKARREIGAGAVALGNLDLISGRACYASFNRKEGLYPGSLPLWVLTRCRNNKLVYDQDSNYIYIYTGGDAVKIFPDSGLNGSELHGEPYDGARY